MNIDEQAEARHDRAERLEKIAMHAMQGMLLHDITFKRPRDLVRMAFEYADDFLAESERRRQQ